MGIKTKILFLILISSFMLSCGEQSKIRNTELVKLSDSSKMPSSSDSLEIKQGKNSVDSSLKNLPVKIVSGRVASLTECFLGNYAVLTREKAKFLAEIGQILILLCGNGNNADIYFVLNEDMNIATKELAKYAGGTIISVEGKVETIDNINIIIAHTISKRK